MTDHTAHRSSIVLLMSALLFSMALTLADTSFAEVKKMHQEQQTVELPPPVRQGKMSLEETLQKRESVRNFSPQSLTKQELSQLLWALQGRTRNWGARTAPSAGALFPLEIYVALPEGVFHYQPNDHKLLRIIPQDIRAALAKAALGQDCVREAPAVFVIAAVYERTARKYGNRAQRYAMMEVGHAGQNLLLQAVSLGLGAVPVGAFHDDMISRALNLPVNHAPLYLIPVGRQR